VWIRDKYCLRELCPRRLSHRCRSFSHAVATSTTKPIQKSFCIERRATMLAAIQQGIAMDRARAYPRQLPEFLMNRPTAKTSRTEPHPTYLSCRPLLQARDIRTRIRRQPLSGPSSDIQSIDPALVYLDQAAYRTGSCSKYFRMRSG
jgi:hypothetical protein